MECIDALRAEDWMRPDGLDRLHALYDFCYRRLPQRAGAVDADEILDGRSLAWQRTVRDLLDTKRRELIRVRDGGEIPDDVTDVTSHRLSCAAPRTDPGRPEERWFTETTLGASRRGANTFCTASIQPGAVQSGRSAGRAVEPLGEFDDHRVRGRSRGGTCSR